jgi:hypothetical protein
MAANLLHTYEFLTYQLMGLLVEISSLIGVD